MTNTQIEEYEEVNCCTCDILFFIRKDFLDRKRNDHSAFHCPNGHGNVYPITNEQKDAQLAITENARLKKDNETLREELLKEKDKNIIQKIFT